MSSVVLQIAIIVLLILLNGLFAMAETALVSSRKARLRQRAEEGNKGARAARELADSPNRFLSTVQIGISLPKRELPQDMWSAWRTAGTKSASR